jgi:hypothetical protein
MTGKGDVVAASFVVEGAAGIAGFESSPMHPVVSARREEATATTTRES